MAEERRDKGQFRPEAGRPVEGKPSEGPKGPEGSREKRRFGKRRFSHVRETVEAEKVEAIEAAPKPEPVACPLCGKPVYDLSTAVSADREKPMPAHFDCVIERVAAAENLGPNEKLVYLGSGSFGVVEFKDKGETAFTVKRRVQWEKEGDKQDWRKSLSARISKI